MTNKTIYITGCLGFIGGHVTRECLSKGYLVYGVDKETYAADLKLVDEFSQNKNFNYIKSDICNLNEIKKCDYFFNLAAESHVDNSIQDQDPFVKSNIEGVYNILKLLTKIDKQQRPIFVQFSTDEVYGDIVDGAYDENALLNPSNPYSATKAAADQLIFAWKRTFDLKAALIRPTNNYGTHQFREKLIPASITCLNNKQKIRLHDSGNPIRTWLHAEDTAKFVTKMLELNIQEGIYNLSGNIKFMNKEVVQKILNIYFSNQNKDDFEEYVDLNFNRPGQDVRYSVDDSKARSLGWKPLKNFDEALVEIVNFYKK